jgi:hypothetical protein
LYDTYLTDRPAVRIRSFKVEHDIVHRIAFSAVSSASGGFLMHNLT